MLTCGIVSAAANVAVCSSVEVCGLVEFSGASGGVKPWFPLEPVREASGTYCVSVKFGFVVSLRVSCYLFLNDCIE